MATATEGVVKGRWGFYPCEVETYRKLKRLNYLALLSKIADKKHARWENKLPRNRFGDEPKKGFAGFHEKVKTGTYTHTTIRDMIEADYRKARYPQADESQVRPLSFRPERIDDWLAQAEIWLKKA